MRKDPVVFVVDPDPQPSDAVRNLVHTMNLECETFASGQEFLNSYSTPRPGCLVLEVRIPGVSGLQIQEHLAQHDPALPVIFVARQPAVSIAVRAMRAGALHFLEKPFREHELWDAIQEAITVNRLRREANQRRRQCMERLERLNPSERRLLEMIADGRSKDEMAATLDVCVRTVELRCRQLMKKLEMRSMIELMSFSVLARQSAPGCLRAVS